MNFSSFDCEKESMIVQIVGSAINLALDPILIYGFLFVPVIKSGFEKQILK